MCMRNVNVYTVEPRFSVSKYSVNTRFSVIFLKTKMNFVKQIE